MKPPDPELSGGSTAAVVNVLVVLCGIALPRPLRSPCLLFSGLAQGSLSPKPQPKDCLRIVPGCDCEDCAPGRLCDCGVAGGCSKGCGSFLRLSSTASRLNSSPSCASPTSAKSTLNSFRPRLVFSPLLETMSQIVLCCPSLILHSLKNDLAMFIDTLPPDCMLSKVSM